MRIATAATLAMLMASGAALAQPATTPPPASAPRVAGTPITHAETVSELAAICDPPWDGVDRLQAIAYCQGFVTSAGQYHVLLHPTGGPQRPLFCLPTPAPSIARSGVAFAGWARENPRYANEPALDGFLRWAQASFPCASGAAPRAARTPR